MRRRIFLYLPAVGWAAQPRRWQLPGEGEVFAALDLTRPELGEVAAAWSRGQRDVAWRRLLEYFRCRTGVRYDFGSLWSDPPDPSPAADRLLEENLFDLGLGYPPQRYPPPIAWSADPVGDIEWVANMHRFLWQDVLLAAYARTGDERYAGDWVRLAGDWIQKHSLVDPARFEWLDIQVGIRVSRLLQAFERLKHTAAFHAKFLPLFLAAIHAHARKSYLYPRRDAHNKAIIEADGLYRVATLFPEFRGAARWQGRALEVLETSLNAQLTPKGVQREWTPSYHNLVAMFMADLLWLAALNRQAMPEALRETVRRMFDFSVAMTAPDWTTPMFGDTQRAAPAGRSAERPWRALLRAAETFEEPEWKACAEGDPGGIKIGSRCFPASGMYFLRSFWQPEAVFMALHCSPPAVSAHDQPDNGTFELYAGGRWLMPDSGAFAYPDTPFAGERPWFRQTAVHQTLTLDRRNSENRPRHLLWVSERDFDCVVFENQSYAGLIHRRTVFRLGSRAFLLLDEAIGDAVGTLELHFQFAPGPFELDAARKRGWTRFGNGANVLLYMPEESPVDLAAEPGQISYVLNRKQDRPAIACRHHHRAPAHFLTALVLFEADVPAVSASLRGSFECGQSEVEINFDIEGQRWRVGRDIAGERAWCW